MIKPGGTFNYALDRWIEPEAKVLNDFLTTTMAVILSDVTLLDDGTPPAGDIDPNGRITLTEMASERLGLQTIPISEAEVGGSMQKVVPYAAVLYDLNGETWLYSSPEPLVIVRQPIAIGDIAGDVGVLVDGPPVGTEVVTTGAAELLGVESGLGND
jgi:hypothetical protein